VQIEAVELLEDFVDRFGPDERFGVTFVIGGGMKNDLCPLDILLQAVAILNNRRQLRTIFWNRAMPEASPASPNL
jgi:hypothetical protein